MSNLPLIVASYLFFQMLFVWVIAKHINNPSIVDVAWPIGLSVSGFIYLFSQELHLRLFVIMLLLFIWGTRLAAYLYFSRIKKGIVDKRYLKLSENWKFAQSLRFLLNFELQGLFIFIISIPLLFAASQQHTYLNFLDYCGISLCLLGILGETIADLQLQGFKKNNPGKVCNLGLWRFSRHPNYFFDWLTWCGFTCFSLQANNGWLSLSSPLLLFLIMTKITGPMTEQGSISAKGELYLDYQRKTAPFFPWFRKT